MKSMILAAVAALSLGGAVVPASAATFQTGTAQATWQQQSAPYGK
ncbi:MAG TPA: hypothetical protein PLD10_00815 [Rhodopila sp.]|nr:hypothetical protein [Rhodopila sp.]